jgi:hypothetical protein
VEEKAINGRTPATHTAAMQVVYSVPVNNPYQCCGPEIIIIIIIFFFGSGSYLDLNFGIESGFESGSGLLMKNTLEIQIL